MMVMELYIMVDWGDELEYCGTFNTYTEIDETIAKVIKEHGHIANFHIKHIEE